MTLGHPITEQVQPGRSMNGGHATVMTSAREATHADAAAIADLLGQLGYPATAKQVDERLTYWFRTPFSRIILAVDDDTRVLGCLSLHAIPCLERTGRWVRVESLVVAELARGTGAGRLLVDAAEDLARGWGCDAVELTSSRARPGPRFLPSLRATRMCATVPPASGKRCRSAHRPFRSALASNSWSCKLVVAARRAAVAKV